MTFRRGGAACVCGARCCTRAPQEQAQSARRGHVQATTTDGGERGPRGFLAAPGPPGRDLPLTRSPCRIEHHRRCFEIVYRDRTRVGSNLLPPFFLSACPFRPSLILLRFRVDLPNQQWYLGGSEYRLRLVSSSCRNARASVTVPMTTTSSWYTTSSFAIASLRRTSSELLRTRRQASRSLRQHHVPHR